MFDFLPAIPLQLLFFPPPQLLSKQASAQRTRAVIARTKPLVQADRMKLFLTRFARELG